MEELDKKMYFLAILPYLLRFPINMVHLKLYNIIM